MGIGIIDLKQIYTAANEDQASVALLEFAEKWDKKYPMISASWTRHWQEINPFLQYPEFIKRAITLPISLKPVTVRFGKLLKPKDLFLMMMPYIKLYIWLCKTLRKNGQYLLKIRP